MTCKFIPPKFIASGAIQRIGPIALEVTPVSSVLVILLIPKSVIFGSKFLSNKIFLFCQIFRMKAEVTLQQDLCEQFLHWINAAFQQQFQLQF